MRRTKSALYDAPKYNKQKNDWEKTILLPLMQQTDLQKQLIKQIDETEIQLLGFLHNNKDILDKQWANKGANSLMAAVMAFRRAIAGCKPLS